jgi:anti-anti-sigma factor
MLEIVPSPQDQDPCLRLKGELTIYSVAEIKGPLSQALDRGPSLHLNLAGVEELDTAGVQLLVWLKQEAERRGKGLVLSAHSPAVVEVFDLLKVAGLFGDPILFAPSAS